MSRTIRIIALTLFVVMGSQLHIRAQDDPKFFDVPKTPAQFWRAIQYETAVGQFDLGAKYLNSFLQTNPDEKALIDLVKAAENGPGEKRGLVPFLRLRNVPVWSSDPVTNVQAKKDVETLIDKMTAAIKNNLSNVDNILFYAKQLVATPEEGEYAQQQLRASGVYATPILLGLLQTNPPEEQRAAILELLPSMDSDSVPPQIAFLQIRDPALQLSLLESLFQRRDLQSMRARAETDIVPTLWYLYAQSNTPKILRDQAARMLETLLRVNLDKRSPAIELTKSAELFALHKAQFTNNNQVPIWKFDEVNQVLVPPPQPPYTKGTAEEFFGLQYARWALEIKPAFDPAQIMFLTLAINGAYSRASLDVPLAKASPVVYELVATAPTGLLLATLDQAMRDQNSATVMGILQVFADRADRSASVPTASTSLLVQALSYPHDTRVNFAAANALLRIPGPPLHQSTAKILEILRRAIVPTPQAPRPKVMIGDKDPLRVRTLSQLLINLGYEPEQAISGRDLLRRLRQTNDYAAVFLDHTLADPMVPDVLGSLRADARYSWMPVFLVASTPKTEQPTLDTLIARLALLIATTDELKVPLQPMGSTNDPNIGFVDPTTGRKTANRSTIIRNLVTERTERLIRLLDSTEMPVSNALKDRLEQLTLLCAAADMPLEQAQLIRIQTLQEQLKDAPVDRIENEQTFLGRLVILASRIESELTPELNERLDRLRIQTAATGVVGASESPRDLVLETKLQRLIAPGRRVFVVPESLSDAALQNAFNLVQAEPGAQPRSEASRKTDALTAMNWLREIATGQVPGYDIRLADQALREQLSNPDPDMMRMAIDAVRRLPNKEAQQDLSTVVTRADRPIEARRQAADALIQHIQQFGKLLSPAQADAVIKTAIVEQDPEFRAILGGIVGVLTGTGVQSSARFKQYVPPLPMGMMPVAPIEPKKEPVPEPKKDDME